MFLVKRTYDLAIISPKNFAGSEWKSIEENVSVGFHIFQQRGKSKTGNSLLDLFIRVIISVVLIVANTEA